MTDDYIEQSDLQGITPVGEEKHNVHQFLHNVAIAKDTTKIGNLVEEELGKPKLPQRTLKELELFCRDILDQEAFADYFKKKSEILTATSLSKDAKLIDLAVIQRREVADRTQQQPRKENKGWFKRKQPQQPTEGSVYPSGM